MTPDRRIAGIDPDTARALEALRSDSVAPPSAESVIAARAAMHRAAAARREAAIPALPLRLRLRRTAPGHRGIVWGAVAGAAAATVMGLGWNAPAGSTLHDIRLTRERLALAVPGNDGVSLRLSYAEERLAEATSGSDRAAALREAAGLLDDARLHLPADPTSPQWTRWQHDDRQLQQDEAESNGGGAGDGNDAGTGQPPSAGGGAGQGGTHGGGRTSTSSPSAAPGQGGGDGRDHPSASPSAGGDRGDDHHGTPSPKETPSPSHHGSPEQSPSSTPSPDDGGSQGGGSDGGSPSGSSPSGD